MSSRKESLQDNADFRFLRFWPIQSPLFAALSDAEFSEKLLRFHHAVAAFLFLLAQAEGKIDAIPAERVCSLQQSCAALLAAPLQIVVTAYRLFVTVASARRQQAALEEAKQSVQELLAALAAERAKLEAEKVMQTDVLLQLAQVAQQPLVWMTQLVEKNKKSKAVRSEVGEGEKWKVGERAGDSGD